MKKAQQPYHVNPLLNKWEEENHRKHMERRLKQAKSTLPVAAQRKAPAPASSSPSKRAAQPLDSNAAASAIKALGLPAQGAADLDLAQLDALIALRLKEILGTPLVARIQQAVQHAQCSGPPHHDTAEPPPPHPTRQDQPSSGSPPQPARPPSHPGSSPGGPPSIGQAGPRRPASHPARARFGSQPSQRRGDAVIAQAKPPRPRPRAPWTDDWATPPPAAAGPLASGPLPSPRPAAVAGQLGSSPCKAPHAPHGAAAHGSAKLGGGSGVGAAGGRPRGPAKRNATATGQEGVVQGNGPSLLYPSAAAAAAAAVAATESQAARHASPSRLPAPPLYARYSSGAVGGEGVGSALTHSHLLAIGALNPQGPAAEQQGGAVQAEGAPRLALSRQLSARSRARLVPPPPPATHTLVTVTAGEDKVGQVGEQQQQGGLRLSGKGRSQSLDGSADTASGHAAAGFAQASGGEGGRGDLASGGLSGLSPAAVRGPGPGGQGRQPTPPDAPNTPVPQRGCGPAPTKGLSRASSCSMATPQMPEEEGAGAGGLAGEVGALGCPPHGAPPAALASAAAGPPLGGKTGPGVAEDASLLALSRLSVVHSPAARPGSGSSLRRPSLHAPSNHPNRPTACGLGSAGSGDQQPTSSLQGASAAKPAAHPAAHSSSGGSSRLGFPGRSPRRGSDQLFGCTGDAGLQSGAQGPLAASTQPPHPCSAAQAAGTDVQQSRAGGPLPQAEPQADGDTDYDHDQFDEFEEGSEEGAGPGEVWQGPKEGGSEAGEEAEGEGVAPAGGGRAGGLSAATASQLACLNASVAALDQLVQLRIAAQVARASAAAVVGVKEAGEEGGGEQLGCSGALCAGLQTGGLDLLGSTLLRHSDLEYLEALGCASLRGAGRAGWGQGSRPSGRASGGGGGAQALGGWGDGDADAEAEGEGEEADTWSDSGCVGIEPGIPAGTGQWGDHTSHHPAAPTRHPTSPPPGHATATAAVQRLRAQQQQQQEEGQQHEWQQQQEEGQQQQEAQQQQQATPPPPPIGARVLQGSGQGQEEGLDLDADVGVLLGTCDPHRLRSTSFTATHASPCPLPGFDPCPSSTPPPRHQEGHPRVAHLPAAAAASPGPGQPADPATPLTSPLASVFAHASAPPHAWTSSRVRHQAQPAPPAPWSPPPPSAEQHRHTDRSQMPGRPPQHPTPGFDAAHRLASPQAEQLAGQAGALFDSLRQLHQLMSGPQAARLSPRCTQTGEGSGLDLAGGWAPPPAPTPLATGSRPEQQEEEEEEVDGEEGVAAPQAGGGGRRAGGWRETSSPTLWAHSPPALDPPCQGLSPQPSRGWLGRPSTLAQEQDAEDVEDVPDEQGRAAGSAAAAAVEGEEGEEEEEEGVARQHHAHTTWSSPSPLPGSSSSSGIPGVGAPSGAAGCSGAVWGGGESAQHPAAGTAPQAQSSGAGAAGGMPGLSPRHVLVPQDVAWMASLMATLSQSLSDGQLMDGRLGGSGGQGPGASAQCSVLPW
ncbi:hypothetical protein V8C86DRAFT_3128202 [Haematococcus lacustris]